MKEKSPVSVEVIEWEKFETCIRKKPELCSKMSSWCPAIEEEVNFSLGSWWFFQKNKKIVALNRMASSFVKPTIESAIRRTWCLLKELSPQDLPMNEWHFSFNKSRDITQKDNGFDCGVLILFVSTLGASF